MRLDKFLAHHLGISRKIVTKELKASKITVNGQIIKDGSIHINNDQQVEYDGFLIEPIPEHRYFMLNKPKGYLCSTEDSLHPIINYLLDEPLSEKLFSAGRLDLDSSGLVLLTDDGQWSHRITSPKYQCHKTYLVKLAEPIDTNDKEQFESGILLNGEKEKTQPAKMVILNDFEAEVTLTEGKYHQVKRMFVALGNHVEHLHRKQIGSIVLDVEEGDYRPLTEEEINSF